MARDQHLSGSTTFGEAAAPHTFGDPTVVQQLVAEHMHNSVNGITVSKQQLTEALQEITPQTQTLGAALLAVTLIDPDWKIIRSGLITRDPDGFLPKVDVNFPEGTDVWWRLAMETHSSADAVSNGPNLTLTFQHRIISYLNDCWGPLGWPGKKAGATRAQFIKMLVDKMPSELPKTSVGPGSGSINFICQEINEIQQIAGSSTFGQQVITAPQSTALHAAVNKTPAVTAGTKATVKGQPMSAMQQGFANQILSIGLGLGASTTAIEAVVVEAIAESGMGQDMGWNGSNPTYGGLLAGNVGTFGSLGGASSPAVTVAEINAAFKGGQGYVAGGAIGLARSSSDTLQIAMTNSGSGTQFLSEAGVQGFAGEARAIVAGGGAASISGIPGVPGVPGAAGATAAVAQSDVAQLTRGTPQNADETSWQCMQRLAGEVNWSLFSSPSPHPGVWGNYLYLMSGPTLVAQRPSLYVELSDDGTTWSATSPDTGKQIAADGVVTALSGTTDNTSFQYMETRKIKGKVQHKTAIRRPQTPTQLKFNMICRVLEYCAGDVFVFHNAGPDDGRWIVSDVTQNSLQDLFAQFTLSPPTFPYPEPQGTNNTAATNALANASATQATQAALGGTGLAGVAGQAQQALAKQVASHNTFYSWTEFFNRSDPSATLFTLRGMDCSAFATLCYKAAGLPDPSHQNYNPIGTTFSMIPHCTQISQGSAVPGDLCFFGSSPGATTHVNVYVGNGQSISLGSDHEPAQGPSASMGPSGFLGFYRADVAGAATAAPAAPTAPASAPAPASAQQVNQATGATNSTFGQTAAGPINMIGGIFGSIFGK